VKYSLEHNKVYNSIVNEFKLNSFTLEEMKIEVESLVKVRLGLTKLLKIKNYNTETLELIRTDLIKELNVNECSIKKNKKNQIQLLDEINKIKQDIKITKLKINQLDNDLLQEREKSRQLRAEYSVFVSRGKFIFIKKYIVKKYRIIFSKYLNELSIKIEIQECNERKDKLRREKQNFIYSLEKYNRKINNDKIKFAGFKKGVTNMRKDIEIFNMKISEIKDCKEMEEKFKNKMQEDKLKSSSYIF